MLSFYYDLGHVELFGSFWVMEPNWQPVTEGVKLAAEIWVGLFEDPHDDST